MSTSTRCLFLFTFLLSSVLALPLAKRDVVDPPITSPTASTVWYVGDNATVTWNATDLPPNQINPVGKLVLGFVYNNSENLMLDSPLATNVNYSVGAANVTVPNVPTQDNYIVVLFGDSGNASPQFTIINKASSSTSITSTPVLTTSPGSIPPATYTPANSSPPNVNAVSSGVSSPRPTTGSAATATTRGSQTTSGTSTVVVTSSTLPSSTRSSAAWQNHVPSLGPPLSAALAVIYFVFS